MDLIGKKITFKYKYFTLDKYGRSMFFVNDKRLDELYNKCIELGKKCSLFKNEEDDLILITSNFNSEDLTNTNVLVKEYKDAIRFYVDKGIEWKSF